MADTKITALTAITTVDPAADVLPIVDVSDTSMAASGTTKKITSNQILGAGGTATLASATITGDLTVDTNTLKVDSTNNRVGIGTSSPAAGYSLDVAGNVRANASFQTTDGTNTGVFGTNVLASGVVGITSGTNVPLVFGVNATERMRIDASGNLLVGKTSASGFTVGFQALPSGEISSTMSASSSAASTLNVYSTGAGAYRFYVGMNGTINATNTTISAISDARLKENVQDIDVGLGAILALKPRKFDWKAGKGKDIKGDRGFIAQEFEQVFPNLIDEWKDEAPEGEAPYKSVRQDLIPVLVKAIQELAAEVNALKNA